MNTDADASISKHSKPPWVVVGGGIAGIVAALTLKEERPMDRVILIECLPHIGGLLRSFDYGQHGWFDYGAHVWHETRHPRLDNWVIDILPPHRWSKPDGFTRERPGMFVNGTLQTNGAFIDLRNLPEAQFRACMGDLVVHMNHCKTTTLSDPAPDNAYEFALERFGPTITQTVMAPAIEKVFGRPLSEMHRLALIFFQLIKVTAFDPAIVHDVLHSQAWLSRIGYTDQRDLPAALTVGRRLFYPKHGGMQTIMDALTRKLEAFGVEIWTQAAVTDIQTDGDRVVTLSVKDLDQEMSETVACQQLIWSAGVHPLAGLLGQTRPEDRFDPGPKTVLVNLLVDTPPPAQLNQLFYFYCMEPGFKTYRVVNYPAFCPDAIRPGGYPLTVECFIAPDQVHDKAAIEALAVDELRRMGVMSPQAQVTFAAVEVLAQGFPLPTMQNMDLTETRRQRIVDLGLTNLTQIGILSESDLFFQTPVMIDTVEKMLSLTQPNRSGTLPALAEVAHHP